MAKFSRVVLESFPKKEILPDGTVRTKNSSYIFYTKNGEYHRTDGPALEYRRTGRREWFLNGERHRTDGPAVIDPRHNLESYWVHGKELSKEEFEKHFGDE